MAYTGNIGHLSDIESPWGNAGGVVKTIDDVKRMAQTGVGWIEVGSYTLEPRLGNAVVIDGAGLPIAGAERLVDYYHNPDTGETFNSLGMPNKGMDLVEKEIPEMARIAHAHNKALAINVAPVSDDPVGESIELVTRAYSAGADTVILNAGCPNVIVDDGNRHELLSRNPDMFGRVLLGLVGAELPNPIWVRISPQQSLTNANTIGNRMRAFKIVSAVLTPNTWPGHKPVNEKGEPTLTIKGNVGGKSGPATAENALIETDFCLTSLRASGIDVISSGGIVTARELKLRLGQGAVAGAGTTFYYESKNGWQYDTAKLLTDLANI